MPSLSFTQPPARPRLFEIRFRIEIFSALKFWDARHASPLFVFYGASKVPRSLSDIREHNNFDPHIWFRINDLDPVNTIFIPPIGHYQQCRTGS